MQCTEFDEDLFQDELSRSHEEKLACMMLSDDFPVAVLDLPHLEEVIGQWIPIPGFKITEAVQLTDIHHPVFSRYMGVDSHIWVSPSLRNYRKAWKMAGFKMPVRGSRQLDHLHAKEWAIKQGYAYVVLMDVSSGPNMSAGHIERRLAKAATEDYAFKYPVFYAKEVHWAKLWDLNQLKPGELTKETVGAWKK